MIHLVPTLCVGTHVMRRSASLGFGTDGASRSCTTDAERPARAFPRGPWERGPSALTPCPAPAVAGSYRWTAAPPPSPFRRPPSPSRLADLLAAGGDALGRVAGVDDQRRVPDDEIVVVTGVIGGDQHGILRGEELGGKLRARHVGHVVVPHRGEHGDVRIVVAEDRAAGAEQLHQ